MLDIITKEEYFRWCQNKIVDLDYHSLKGIQDAFIISQLGKTRNQKIAEIGGGNSRILSRLVKQKNRCWNIDKFQGVGQGPKSVTQMSGVKVIREFVGEYSATIPTRFYDVVFSISVIEHISDEKLENFFHDCYRMLKPGGIMIHAIDLYLQDTPSERTQVITKYRQGVEKAGFRWKKEPEITDKLTFKCCFATNSDLTIYQWNKMVSELENLRNNSQSVSIKLIAIK